MKQRKKQTETGSSPILEGKPLHKSHEAFRQLLENESVVRAIDEIRKAKANLHHLEDTAHRRLEIAKTEMKKLIVTFIVWMAAAYLMAVMGVVASMRMPHNAAVLPDLGFDFFQYVDLPHLPNLGMMIIIVSTVCRVVAHPSRVVIFRRLLIVHSVISVIRSFFIVATSLPDPLPGCHGFELKRNILLEGVYRAATLGFDVCGDVFFSGHIAICTLMGMVWEQYTTVRLWKNVMWALIVMESCLLLSMRWHYTIDILIGVYLGYRIWSSYHSVSPLWRWMESAPAMLHMQNIESEESIESWLSRIPSVKEMWNAPENAAG
eukprot:TRINITY_DN13264_c0_g1_i1.p1 TRINITY_DN13264_c0_g1~~TRINITY_DN13264_c0_g1_i1.p1  ORF type:complete len:320 (-),score=42.64 TRINITY_DN13264_c0_g1_i1:145-1104(-)